MCLIKRQWSAIGKAFRDRKAGLSLETALILPIFLIVGYFLLSVLIGLRTDLVYRHALTQWRNETAMIISAIDTFAKTADLEAGGVLDFLEEADKDILKSAITDVGSSVTFGYLFQKRLDYWLGKSAGAAGVVIPAQERQLILRWHYGEFRLDHELNYELVTPWRRYPRRISGAIPLWIQTHPTKATAEDDGEESDIWSEHVFVRGAYFRDLAGANLPRNFPVYCRYDNGTATACRSLDPNAPSYGDSEQVIRQIRRELNRIDNFTGGKVGDSGPVAELTPAMISTKVLILYIPSNTPPYWDSVFDGALRAEASARGVRLEIRRHGKSQLYTPPAEEP